MQNTTKFFYEDGIWQAIDKHPQYDLGQREQKALVRFLPEVTRKCEKVKNILHLGVAIGREIPPIVQRIPVKKYVLNDICTVQLQKVFEQARKEFLAIKFIMAPGDVEKPATISRLRQQVKGLTLIVLIANGVIFSNRQMDSNIRQAMKPDDLFLLTIETAHNKMYDSYLIKPVFKLLSQSGLKVTEKNVKIYYDKADHCLKMACGGKILLSSYKPTISQLRERMLRAEFNEVILRQYNDIHLLTALYRIK